MSFAPLLLVLVALIGIQFMGRRRRVESHRALLTQLEPGDEVMTSGGLIGEVAEIDDQEVLVAFAPGVLVRVAKAAIIGRPQPAPESDTHVSGLDAPLPREDGD